MITWLLGKPGDGKTLYAVNLIARLLIESERFIVTDIPINLPDLVEFVTKARLKRDKDDVFEVDKRLRCITKTEAHEFYRYRPGGIVLPHSPDFTAGETKRLSIIEHDKVMEEMFTSVEQLGGVTYFIDELHDKYPSREWARVGRGIQYYATKHRHLSDEFFGITQAHDQVDASFRRLVSESFTIRNQIRRNIGPVKLRPIFKYEAFYGLPNPSGNGRFDTGSFDLDANGLAKCYRTRGAFGGSSKPEEIKNKGFLPWWVLPIGGILLVLCVGALIVAFPLLGAKAAKMMVENGSNQKMLSTVTGGAFPANVDTPKTANSQPAAADSPLKSSVAPGAADRSQVNDRGYVAPVFVRGILRNGASVIVTLTDGRSYDESDDELERVGRGWVVIEGRKYRMAPMGPGSAPASAQPAIPAQMPGDSSSPARPVPVVSESAWETHADGVSRLRQPETMASAFSR